MTSRQPAVAHPARRRTKAARVRMDRASRERQLLDCAIQAFAERGNARAVHADVARLAHVSVATVFEYFPTRHDLVRAVLAEAEAFLARVVATGDRAPNAVAAVMEIFHTFEACVDEQPHHMRVWLDWSTSIREDMWPRYVAVQEKIIRTFESLIQSGRQRGEIPDEVVAADAARIVVGQAHMVVLMRFAGLGRARVIRFVDDMIGSTLRTARQ